MELVCRVVSSIFIYILMAKSMSTSHLAPTYTMNNGLRIPAIALGTYMGYDLKQGRPVRLADKELKKVVEDALDIGYRHFDTASYYDTEGEIGEGVREKINNGTLRREDVFITTKLWNTDHNMEQVLPALRRSLKKLDMEYVDLYLMHWPMAITENGTFLDTDYMETWRGMVEAHRLGLARAIGVSNFNITQLTRLLVECTYKPQVLQIEVHPQNVETELVNFAQKNNIVVMGAGPFGALVKRYGLLFPGPKLSDPVFTSMAQKYGKTSGQIVLAWMANRKIIPIPKTVKWTHLEENMAIFDVPLTEDEVTLIEGYNLNTRYNLPAAWKEHRYYPF